MLQKEARIQPVIPSKGMAYQPWIGLSVATLGFIVCTAWIFDIKVLKFILSDFASMKFNTALCFLLTGISYYVYSKNGSSYFFIFLCLLTGFIGSLSLSQDIFSINLGIDEFFVRDPDSLKRGNPSPGRPSPATSVCFIIFGFGSLGINSRWIFVQKTSQYFFHFITVVALIALQGYLFDVSTTHKLIFLRTVALHTCILFLVLSVTITMFKPKLTALGIFFENKLGSKLARNFFPKVFILLFVIGVFITQLNKYQLISEDFGIALHSVLVVMLILYFIWTSTRWLNKIDEDLNRKNNMLLSSLENLKQSEEKFKSLLEATPEALVIVDETGTIAMVNLQAQKLFGYHRDELIGHKIEKLVPAKAKGLHVSHREKYINKPITRLMGDNMELYGLRKDGSEFPVEVGLSPFKSDGLILSSVIDITIRKENEENQRLISILESKSKEMEQFAYITSHDLRQPLLTITNYIEALKEDHGDKLDDEAKTYLASISGAAYRMEELIHGLLDYSRLSQIKKLQKTDCKQLVKSLLLDISSIIDNNQAQIHIENLPTVNAYPLELKLLFQNLITNAIKFRKHDVTPEINISSKQINPGWRFEISDNGIGMEQKDIPKIFELFQRLHHIDEYEGTGIGLAHCKKIAELHHGKIWVKSEIGHGSRFYFTIKT